MGDDPAGVQLVAEHADRLARWRLVSHAGKRDR
jgi:hypothetical protein